MPLTLDSTPARPPVVLVIAGHDPTGGAGVQADIEAIAAQGAHPVTLITALTQQDSHRVRALYPVDGKILLAQAEVLLADVKVAVVKIGLLGSAEIAQLVAQLLDRLPACPLVLDPVLAAGGGGAEASAELRQVLWRELLPRTSLLTPNTLEAHGLTGETEPLRQARQLLTAGCGQVLITGTHDATTAAVINRYYSPGSGEHSWSWPRLAGSYHGSGCTLASAIAANLALGKTMIEALTQAQDYTWHSLRQARAIGSGQAIPRRWMQDKRR